MPIPEEAKFQFGGSSADSARHFIYGGGLTPERAGYELARQTLYLLSTDDVGTAEYLTKTLNLFLDDDERVHEPPLSDELTEMCQSYLTNGSRYLYNPRFITPRGPETAMLLNKIIDHGSRPGVGESATPNGASRDSRDWLVGSADVIVEDRG